MTARNESSSEPSRLDTPGVRPTPRRVDLTRVYRFNAGHRLFHPDRDEGWNLRVFGKCSYAGGHGHNYTLEVTVRGVPDRETGWVIPREVLDRDVAEHVIEPIDHRNLNDVLELLAGPAPTTEVLAVEVWRRLAPHIAAPATLHRLVISETSKNTFEYFGPPRG